MKHHRAVLGDVPVSGDVTGEPAVEVGRGLVERWQVLEEARQVVDEDPIGVLGGPAVREPLEQLRVLDRVELRDTP